MSEILEQHSVISALILMTFLLFGKLFNFISYTLMKERIIARQQWDLNICCGKTDAGKINADIIKHARVPNFVLIKDIYNLPFADKQFKKVLCSHTIEHVEKPDLFFRELRRVGETITIILPPIWDVFAAFNFFEHKWIFLTVRKTHHSLPRYLPLFFAGHLHKFFGQRFKA